MARYLDTGIGAGAADQCLGAWLEREVIVGIRAFRAQLGFFNYGALESFAPTLRKAGEAGSPIRLVVGSNNGSLSQVDLSRTWSLFDGLTAGTLTVVAYSNALFHAKVIHVVRRDNSRAAIIGSGNLTDRWLGRNVEAAISLNTAEGDDMGLFRQIEEAIDRWHACDDDGVYQIESADDVRRLTAAALIDLPQPPLPTLPIPTRQGSALKAGRRPRLWRPAAPAVSGPRGAVALRRPVGAARAPVRPLKWCKKLPSSDAQWVRKKTKNKKKTNPTGKLRLAEAGFPIDHRTYFRHELLQPVVWSTEVRLDHRTKKPKTYEFADIDFAATVHGRSLGVQTLRVDHAQHREAAQGNIVTVLAWGPVLGKELRSRSYVGSWVLIERRSDGTFALSIERDKPMWAP